MKSMKKKNRKSRKGIKAGQAPALSAKLWKEWIKFVGAHCGARIAVILALTGNFGLRCGEALALKREDINLNSDIPKIRISGDTQGNRKSPGDVYVRKRHIQWLRDLMQKGWTVMRTKGHKHGTGAKKVIQCEDTYTVPEKGFLFTSRRNAKTESLHYHAVYAHVHKQAPKFLEFLKQSGQQWSSEISKLRPHSGRATLITELMGEGMSTALSMKYA
jgi:integrase